MFSMPCFWRNPKGSSLVLHDQASERGRWCPQNEIWVCLGKLSWGLSWKSVLCEQLLRSVETRARRTDGDSTHFAGMVPTWLCTRVRSQFSYPPPPAHRILKETKISNAMIRNCTPRCHLCTMQRMLVKLMCVVCSPIPTSLVIHITSHMEVPLLTSPMSSLCRDCYSPSPRIHSNTVVCSPCPVH